PHGPSSRRGVARTMFMFTMTQHQLHARSYFIDRVGADNGYPFPVELPSEPAEFFRLLPRNGVTAWVRGHSGLIGWGELTRCRTVGPTRFTQASTFWKELVSDAQVDDDVHLPGSGPVAFGSFGFSDRSEEPSVLIVPKLVFGRHSGRVWVTVMSFDAEPDAGELSGPSPLERPRDVRVSAGESSEWQRTVAHVVDCIAAGEAQKVV